MSTYTFVLYLISMVLSASAVSAQFIPDSTFNNVGVADYYQWTGGYKNGDRFTYHTDGGIVVGGRYDNRLAIWKYQENGLIDSAFGENGATYYTLPSDRISWVKNIETLDDGSIIIMAQVESSGVTNFAYTSSSILLAKLTASGNFDLTFGDSGISISKPVAGYEYVPVNMYIDRSGDGSIFVGGFAPEYGIYDCLFGTGAWFLAKFDNTGHLDTGFNTSGCIVSSSEVLKQAPTATPLAVVHDIKVVEGNKILFTGMLQSIDSSIFIARLNPDGSYDPTFGLNGRIIRPIEDITLFVSERGTKIRFLHDLGIIMFRYEYIPGAVPFNDSTEINILKLHADGSRDYTFAAGTGGILKIRQAGIFPVFTFDQDHRIIMSWYEPVSPTLQKVGYRRILPTGIPDTEWSPSGTFYSMPLNPDEWMQPSDIRDIRFNHDFSEISMVGLRSNSDNPITFRILNYKIKKEDNTGTDEEHIRQSILIYPNPASSVITIASNRSDELHAVYICNIEGKIVQQYKAASGTNISLDVSGLMRGNYFLLLHTKKGKHIIKSFVKL